MNRLNILFIFIISNTTLIAQNIHFDIGFTKINEDRLIWNIHYGIELNLHKVVPIKENRLNVLYGLGYNFELNPSDCFARYDFQTPLDIQIWPYEFNPRNCEITYQSRSHNLYAQIGLAFRILNSEKINIEVQAVNKISAYDRTKSYYEDGDLPRNEREREIGINNIYFNDYFVPQLKLLFNIKLDETWLKLGFGNTYVRKNDQRFSVNLGIEL